MYVALRSNACPSAIYISLLHELTAGAEWTCHLLEDFVISSKQSLPTERHRSARPTLWVLVPLMLRHCFHIRSCLNLTGNVSVFYAGKLAERLSFTHDPCAIKWLARSGCVQGPIETLWINIRWCYCVNADQFVPTTWWCVSSGPSLLIIDAFV